MPFLCDAAAAAARCCLVDIFQGLFCFCWKSFSLPTLTLTLYIVQLLLYYSTSTMSSNGAAAWLPVSYVKEGGRSVCLSVAIYILIYVSSTEHQCQIHLSTHVLTSRNCLSRDKHPYELKHLTSSPAIAGLSWLALERINFFSTFFASMRGYLTLYGFVCSCTGGGGGGRSISTKGREEKKLAVRLKLCFICSIATLTFSTLNENRVAAGRDKM